LTATDTNKPGFGNLIWPYNGGFVVHCNKLSDAARILGWIGTHQHSEYHYPGGKLERDVWIPREMKKRALGAISGARVLW
jgi:hypothetical protein